MSKSCLGGDNMEPIFMALTFFVVLFSVLSDIRTHRIPNKLLLFLLIINIISLFMVFETQNACEAIDIVISRLLHSCFVFLFLYPFFTIGAIGAGDVKLLFILFLGLDEISFFSLSFCLFATILSVLCFIKSKNLIKRLKHLKM